MNAMPAPRPVLFLVSAPSGAGKTTLCKRLLEEFPELRFSVSCTTRAPRVGERDGVDYVFLDRAAFEREIARHAFLEYAEVYGNYYGTRVSFVAETLRQGGSVLLDVDVQGARLIRAALQREEMDDILVTAYCDVFVFPPSLISLRERLETRGKDAPEVIERRLQHAQTEMAEAGQYAYQLVNADLDAAYQVLKSIYVAARHRTWGAAEPE